MKSTTFVLLIVTCVMCAVGWIVVRVPGEVVAEEEAPLARYIGKEVEPLTLDATRLAVFVQGDERSKAARAALALLGVPAASVRPIHAPGWSLVSLEGPLALPVGAAPTMEVEAAARRVAAVAGIDYATPVFLDVNGDPMYPAQDVLVRFAPGVAGPAAMAAIGAVAPQQVADCIDAHWGGMSNVYRLRGAADNGFDVLRIANTLAQRPDVLWSEPDFMVTVTLHGGDYPNDPSFPNCWGHDNTGQILSCSPCLGFTPPPGVPGMDMSMLDAWQITTGDPDIIVAVFDSGINQTHADINQLTPGFDFVNAGGDGGPWNACDTHGTAVAGAVSAILNNNLGGVGVAPGARSVSMKIFNQSDDDDDTCVGSGIQWSWVIGGLDAALNIGARVTNHSYTWSLQSSAVEDKFSETFNAGIVHVASAGNAGNNAIGYPSSIITVLSVAALDPDGTLTGFSNSGEGLFISAPGVGVCGTGSCFCGTSASAPSVAGVAALVLSLKPDSNPIYVWAVLAEGAKDLGVPGYDETYGWGFVNARDTLITTLCDGMQGPCFQSNGTPGCADGFCCAKVCADDSFCCDTMWDTLCALKAIDACLPCPSDGPCDQAHLGVGCNIESCCQSVCLADSFCCDEKFGWDHVCVALAVDFCGFAPGNDDCANATEIFDGFNPFSISNASNDGPFQVECGWDPLFTKDVWYDYTATCTGLLTVSTCGTAPFQTWVGVYDTAVCPPSSVSLMSCGTSVPGCSGNPTVSGVFVQNGKTYKVRIGAANPSHGSGQVFVQCHTLWDNCQQPLVLGPFEGTINFQTRGATTDGVQHPGCGANPGIYNDIWYDWFAPCTGTLTVETCNQADFDTKIAVYQGCQSCSTQQVAILGCNDDSPGCAGGTSRLNIPVQQGQCYKVRLGGGAQTEFGSGQLTFTCAEPPPNDDCEDAELIVEDHPTPYSNVNATTDGIHHAECLSQILHDLWYQRIATCTGTMTVSTCNTVDYDSMIAVYDGCDCPPDGAGDAELLACNNNAPGCFNGSEVTVPVTQGKCYHIRVGSAPIPLGGDPPASKGSGKIDITFECAPFCPDLTGDGSVGVPDLLALLSCWGPLPGPAGCEAADFNGDGNVGVPDLLELLAGWGPCPD